MSVTSGYRFELEVREATHEQAHEITDAINEILERVLGPDVGFHGDIIPVNYVDSEDEIPS